MIIGGLDVGTTGCKIVLYNEKSELLATYYNEYDAIHKNGQHEINFADIKTRAKAASDILSDVFVKDFYNAEDGSCALTLRFSFVSNERTLTKQETAEAVDKIVAALGLSVKA